VTRLIGIEGGGDGPEGSRAARPNARRRRRAAAAAQTLPNSNPSNSDRYSIIFLKLTDATANITTSKMRMAATSRARLVMSPLINRPRTASTA